MISACFLELNLDRPKTICSSTHVRNFKLTTDFASLPDLSLTLAYKLKRDQKPKVPLKNK